ncbi:MAG: alpha-ribazole phosphatase family protein [Betaproteobacteria bacterium]|nr:alpha-ribazole phosphatase family protein [Betaproteobacteria bacterium]
MILHLVRHPRPRIDPGVCYGRLDVEAENAEVVAVALRAGLPPGLPVWSSPLARCRALAQALHVSPCVDERLAEMDFGNWEGMAWDDIPRAELDAWAADVAGYAPPGGESPRALQRRALAFVASLDVPEAVVVTHAGVMRTLVAHVRGLPPERWTELRFAYGSRTVLAFRR